MSIAPQSRVGPQSDLAQGVQASVYNVKAKSWIAPSEAVNYIEQGKEKAAEYAKCTSEKPSAKSFLG